MTNTLRAKIEALPRYYERDIVIRPWSDAYFAEDDVLALLPDAATERETERTVQCGWDYAGLYQHYTDATAQLALLTKERDNAKHEMTDAKKRMWETGHENERLHEELSRLTAAQEALKVNNGWFEKRCNWYANAVDEKTQQIITLEAEREALRPYLQHLESCAVWKCSNCDYREWMHYRDYDLDDATCVHHGKSFTANVNCTCGLSALTPQEEK